MVDISFQGAELTLNCPKLNGVNVLLDFGDEGTPVEFQNSDTVGFSGNMNGTLVTWSRYQPIQFDITLLSGSESDVALRKLLYAQHIGGRRGGMKLDSVSSLVISTASLNVPAIYTNDASVQGGGLVRYEFKKGRMTSGNMGQGANAEGKMTSRRYHFVFEGGTYALEQSNRL